MPRPSCKCSVSRGGPGTGPLQGAQGRHRAARLRVVVNLTLRVCHAQVFAIHYASREGHVPTDGEDGLQLAGHGSSDESVPMTTFPVGAVIPEAQNLGPSRELGPMPRCVWFSVGASWDPRLLGEQTSPPQPTGASRQLSPR